MKWKLRRRWDNKVFGTASQDEAPIELRICTGMKDLGVGVMATGDIDTVLAGATYNIYSLWQYSREKGVAWYE